MDQASSKASPFPRPIASHLSHRVIDFDVLRNEPCDLRGEVERGLGETGAEFESREQLEQ
jgi:hypothetical protein